MLKEGKSIPLLPQELEATWNGKGRCGATWLLVLVLRPESLSTTYSVEQATKGLSAGLCGPFPVSFRCPSPEDLFLLICTPSLLPTVTPSHRLMSLRSQTGFSTLGCSGQQPDLFLWL